MLAQLGELVFFKKQRFQVFCSRWMSAGQGTAGLLSWQCLGQAVKRRRCLLHLRMPSARSGSLSFLEAVERGSIELVQALVAQARLHSGASLLFRGCFCIVHLRAPAARRIVSSASWQSGCASLPESYTSTGVCKVWGVTVINVSRGFTPLHLACRWATGTSYLAWPRSRRFRKW